MSKVDARIEGGNIVFRAADLADDNEIISLFAKNAAFRRDLVEYVVQRLLTDEVEDPAGP